MIGPHSFPLEVEYQQRKVFPRLSETEKVYGFILDYQVGRERRE